MKRERTQNTEDEMRKKKKESKNRMKDTNESLLRANKDIKRNIIYADPPWEYSNRNKLDITDHYDTLSLNELKSLKVNEIAAKDSMVFIWATGPHLMDALVLIESWGFKYITTYLVWHKTTDGKTKGSRLGYYTRQCAEYLLMGTKGRIGNFKCNNDFIANVFSKDSKEHSRKPSYARKCINKMFHNVPKIELFARASKDLDWDYWGNEITKFGTNTEDTTELRKKQITKAEELSNQPKKKVNKKVKPTTEVVKPLIETVKTTEIPETSETSKETIIVASNMEKTDSESNDETTIPENSTQHVAVETTEKVETTEMVNQ